MIDTHTHILPHMDDGAQHLSDSISMLKEEKTQGADTVVLTSHFYGSRETSENYLARRKTAYECLENAISQLSPEQQQQLPARKLGAEVAWYPSLLDDPNLSRLCFDTTSYLLVEPPMMRWDRSFVSQMYDLINCHGLMPIIAHIDRYFSLQSKEILQEIYSLCIPIQISADAFLSFWMRGRALQAVRKGYASLLISDCHGIRHRKPNLGEACNVIEKKLGRQAVRNLETAAEQLFIA